MNIQRQRIEIKKFLLEKLGLSFYDKSEIFHFIKKEEIVKDSIPIVEDVKVLDSKEDINYSLIIDSVLSQIKSQIQDVHLIKSEPVQNFDYNKVLANVLDVVQTKIPVVQKINTLDICNEVIDVLKSDKIFVEALVEKYKDSIIIDDTIVNKLYELLYNDPNFISRIKSGMMYYGGGGQATVIYSTSGGGGGDSNFHNFPEATTTINNDEFVIYSIADNTYKKITKSNLFSGVSFKTNGYFPSGW
jgi:hypothetical protein